jgi:hypothetical protein
LDTDTNTDSRPIKKATNDPQLAPHIKGQIIIQTCITRVRFMVIKGDQNQDISDHKEQAVLFAQFYESLAIPSKGPTI